MFTNYGTFAYLLRVHVRNINMPIYISRHELSSGCVHAYIIMHAWAKCMYIGFQLKRYRYDYSIT